MTAAPRSAPLQVAILVFDEVEMLDLGGPYEVFTTATRMHQRQAPGSPALFAVQCVARTLQPVRARAGLQVLPDADFASASVCTGAFILAAAGVLTQGPVTTHWEDLADLRARFPHLTVRENVRWVDRGALVTSAGISAGIDMSLHLVTRLAGAALSQRTARQMDTPWNTAP